VSLIYHAFPDEAAATRFLEATGRDGRVHTDADLAAATALFPFELTAPVVLLDRTMLFDELVRLEEEGDARDAIDHDDGLRIAREEELEELAVEHGGRFAGT